MSNEIKAVELEVCNVEEVIPFSVFTRHFKNALKAELVELYELLKLVEEGFDKQKTVNILVHGTGGKRVVDGLKGLKDEEITKEHLINIIKGVISDIEVVDVRDKKNLELHGIAIIIRASITSVAKLGSKLESLGINLETVNAGTLSIKDEKIKVLVPEVVEPQTEETKQDN